MSILLNNSEYTDYWEVVQLNNRYDAILGHEFYSATYKHCPDNTIREQFGIPKIYN